MATISTICGPPKRLYAIFAVTPAAVPYTGAETESTLRI
jgi:hypothetical protein